MTRWPERADGSASASRGCDGARYNVTRSFGDEPIVLDAKEQPVSLSLKSGIFRADIYSQNAVESIADRPLFQLDLIDSFAGQPIADIFAREQQLISTLKASVSSDHSARTGGRDDY